MNALALGKLGLGTAPLGGLFEAVDERTAHATVERAWELGVRYFDTAPLYGSGLAVRRFGAALRGYPRGGFRRLDQGWQIARARRSPRTLQGSAGASAGVRFSAAGVRRSLEESLERLQLDRVDIVLVHDPDGHLSLAFWLAERKPFRYSTILLPTGRIPNPTRPLPPLLVSAPAATQASHHQILSMLSYQSTPAMFKAYCHPSKPTLLLRCFYAPSRAHDRALLRARPDPAAHPALPPEWLSCLENRYPCKRIGGSNPLPSVLWNA